jgi:OmpA-OmpF porin, OOP family
MKRLTCITALLLAGLAPAQAQDYFAGAAVIAPGATHLNDRGQHTESHNDPLRFKLYGGMRYSDHFALEGGYARFNQDRFATPGGAIGISSDTLYVAGRASAHFGESFEVFGRLGVSAQRYRIHEPQAGQRNESGFAPLLGVGVGYKLTDKVTLTLEAEHFGRIGVKQGHFGRGGYSAGLKYSF